MDPIFFFDIHKIKQNERMKKKKHTQHKTKPALDDVYAWVLFERNERHVNANTV